ncbi:MAG: hypothetical protein SWH54_08235 [Thermodesulfobacteriota bacterium]|nr:hypothetical protein [Thermodesulfobacteriota bacterium]
MPPWESVYGGWLKSNLSEIAAVCLFLDIIVKACTAEWGASPDEPLSIIKAQRIDKKGH